MKNNTNQIMKLDLPIWIKYWLAKHKNISYILSEILTGTEFFLQDSAPKKFKMFDIIGRTTQESTTGKNLFNETQLLEITGWQKQNDIYFGDMNNWFLKYRNGFIGLSFDESTQYTISFKGYTTGGTPRIKIVYADSTTSTLNFSATSMTEYSVTTPSGKTISSIQADYGSGSGNTIYLSKFQIEKGTATDYEPFTGGEPAPNPNYEMPIKNTGDNGSVNVKVQNKNLLPFTNQDFTVNNVRYYVQDGSLYFNGTSTSETSSNNTNFKNNFNFILEAGTYKISHKTGVNVVYLYNYDNDSSSLITLGTDTTSQTLTLTKKTKLYIGFYVYQKTFNNINTEIMIEQGSTATSYVPHSEQNISFPLAQGQKLMEGDYPDNDEKVHHKMEEIALNGTEVWREYESYHNTGGDGYCYNLVNSNFKIGVNTSVCTHFKNIDQYNAFDPAIGYIGAYSDHPTIGRKYFITDKETITEWVAYLAEQYANGTPVKIQYELAEEQTEDFTEEQKTAWEQIKKARTYKNITHISSEDETPAELKIQYYKEG